jgi:outer membrane protein TolC
MHSARIARTARLTLKVVPTVASLLASVSPGYAGPFSDPFQTDSALYKNTPGLTDPTNHDCVVPGAALTFPAAVDLALCRNPQTRAAWATAHEQAAALGSAESAWLPTLSLTGQGTRTFGQHADVTGDIVSSPQDTGNALANLVWTLYDFGGRHGRIANARGLLDAAAATASSVEQQTIGTVVQTYYGVVAGDANVAAATTTEEVAQRSLDIARALRSGGAGTFADVLQAETAYDEAVLSRIQTVAAAKSARGTLSVTLGLAADQELRLAPEPVPDEPPALSARMAELMAEAARQRPDLKAAQAQRDAAEAEIEVARALGRPSISFGALHSFTSTTAVPNQDYSQIGLTVTVPIFSGFSVKYGVRQAQAALALQEANLEQVSLKVTLDVWSAYYSLDSANQQLSVTAALTKTAENNDEVALGRYKAGVGTIVDVLTAQAAAATARQFRINAELGWKVARANLALALGRLATAEPLQESSALP